MNWIKKLLGKLLPSRFVGKHIWFTDCDLCHEHEVFSKHMCSSLRLATCEILNLIPDNIHEGAGWWERVKFVKHTGFTDYELREMGIPNRFYLPREVVTDICNSEDCVIGFKPNNARDVSTDKIVWIHYE